MKDREPIQLRVNSIPIHRTPDFAAALSDYQKLLEQRNVHPDDIAKTLEKIKSNPTRKQGNNFINLVQGVTRKLT